MEIASRQAQFLVSELREPVVARPLPEAVRETAEAWGAEHGITVCAATDPDADVPPRVRYEAMAILAETLTYVARHAAAKEVRVLLTAEGGEVVLTVEDDGHGFRPDGCHQDGQHRDGRRPDGSFGPSRNGHYGLIGLAERAERAGGSLSVVSRPGAGTRVAARLPSNTGAPALPRGVD